VESERLDLQRVAVLGAGVMGAGIAAHLANAGFRVLLLDRRPETLDPAEAAAGLSLDHPLVANRYAVAGLKAAHKIRPPAFFLPAVGNRIEVGNFSDDLPRLADCDWVIEVVIERLDIKQQLMQSLEPHLKPGAIISSNTSGLSCAALSEALPAARRTHFCVTHFFNPPRFLKLMELVPGPEADAKVMSALSQVLERRLGKGVVVARDTPNFIANRIGMFAFMSTLHSLADPDLNVAKLDAWTGELIGRARSASFRTADLVGLDTLMHVAANLHERLEHDPRREIFAPPAFVGEMVERGWLGAKTGQGFWRKTKAGLEMLVPSSLDYVPKPDVAYAPPTARGLVARLIELTTRDDEVGRFLWPQLRDLMSYAAECVPEVSDRIEDIDRALRWGFGWRLGPFELWDALGTRTVVDRMSAEGFAVPALVTTLLASGRDHFYERAGGTTSVWVPGDERHEELAARPRVVDLTALRAAHGVIDACDEASLIDLGDDVAVFELHGKLNTLTPALGEFLSACLERVESDHAGLVIGTQAEHFSAGANLALILEALTQDRFDQVEEMVAAFQQLNQQLRFCRRPVVFAPRGRVLGGGCEMVMAGAAAAAAAETYIGLVEVGVGLLPAGGGCKELLRRLDESLPPDAEIDWGPLVQRLFGIVGLARVATSAAEGQLLGFLRASDLVVMNDEHVLDDARRMVAAMTSLEYRPPDARTDIRITGSPGFAALQVGLYNLAEGRQITPHDHVVGTHVARVLCGGDRAPGRISEQDLLDLEREAFMSLCGQRATQQRMEHMLKTGKPLRN
jgi:3-hydroxyacyl-CoA dehydrogenase